MADDTQATDEERARWMELARETLEDDRVVSPLKAWAQRAERLNARIDAERAEGAELRKLNASLDRRSGMIAEAAGDIEGENAKLRAQVERLTKERDIVQNVLRGRGSRARVVGECSEHGWYEVAITDTSGCPSCSQGPVR